MRTPEERRAHEQAAVQVTATMLLEGIPGRGVDWRYRVLVAEDGTSGWVDVEGADPPPDPALVEQHVEAIATKAPAGNRVRILEMRSPLVLESD